MTKLTLLRRYKEGEEISAADVAIERMATDDELMELWRNPKLWSYAVRDPTGFVCGTGEAKTQQECLDVALGHAAVFCCECVYPNLEGWRFLLWPPEGLRD